MKFNTFILITILIISVTTTPTYCLGGSSYVWVAIKGNVQESTPRSDFLQCGPVENAKIAVFVDAEESTIKINVDCATWYLTDKNGNFQTMRYRIPCKHISKDKTSPVDNECIPHRIELIVRSDYEEVKDITKRLIYYKADLISITQDDVGDFILELPIVDLTANHIGKHCGK